MIKTVLLIGLVVYLMRASPSPDHNNAFQLTTFNSDLPMNLVIIDSGNICKAARTGVEAATILGADSIFLAAKLAIKTASKDGNEHSITFAKDSAGNFIATGMLSGDITNGKVNSGWPGAFADIHNHCNHQPPSAGDFYNLVKLNNKYKGYNTRFVLTPNGELYTLYVYDLNAANNFILQHPVEQSPGFSPRFPEAIFDEFDKVSIYFEKKGLSRLLAQERAMAFVLLKYNTGTILLKQEVHGNFVILQTEEVMSGRTRNYVPIDCL